MKISEIRRSLGDDTMVTREDRLLISDLAKALTSAFVTGGRRRKTVPEAIRPRLLELLPRLLGDPPLLREYTQAVREERRRQSVDEILLILPGEEIPIRQIAAEGFHNLDDAVLADLALCPEYLETVQEELYDNPELDGVKGAWLFTAQEQALKSGVASSWKPTVVTVIQPTHVYRKLWLVIGAVCAIGLLLTGLGLFFKASTVPERVMNPTGKSVVNVPKIGQISVISPTVGKLNVVIDEFAMMQNSDLASPYILKVTVAQPVYLMHVFCWESKAAPLWFEWHGPDRERTIPVGTTEVIYPADRRHFHGFAGYMLVFTSEAVPNEFWKILETIPSERMPAANIDQNRDFLLAELAKIGFSEDKVFIFSAVHALINKE